MRPDDKGIGLFVEGVIGAACTLAVVDIFGNDTMTIIEVTLGKR